MENLPDFLSAMGQPSELSKDACLYFSEQCVFEQNEFFLSLITDEDASRVEGYPSLLKVFELSMKEPALRPEQVYRMECANSFLLLESKKTLSAFIQWNVFGAILGRKLEISIDINEDFEFVFLGVIIRGKSKLILLSNGSEIQISVDDKSVVTTDYDEVNKCWVPRGEFGHCFYLDGKRIELSLYTNDFSEIDTLQYLKTKYIDGGTAPEIVDLYSEAARFLSERDPIYTRWVKDVLNQVWIYGSRDETLVDESSTTQWPLGFFAFQDKFSSYEEVALGFVHECTHVHEFLATTAGLLVDSTSGEMFYSAVRGEDRPASGIMTGYHATVNMRNYLVNINRVSEGYEPSYHARESLKLYTKYFDSISKSFLRVKTFTDYGNMFISNILPST